MTDHEAQNTVPSKNQNAKTVYFDEKHSGRPRIAFIGNSITLHNPKAEIGWYGSWGMAASCKENDYLHIIMSKIREKYPEASYCILSGALWERNYKTIDLEESYREAKDFKPDIIITAITENIPKDQFEIPAFKAAMKKLHDYIVDGRENVKIYQRSSFFHNELKIQGIKEYCEENGVKYIYISDIPEDKSNCAYDKFEHSGVACHPGDKGMRIMAERFLAEIEKNLL